MSRPGVLIMSSLHAVTRNRIVATSLTALALTAGCGTQGPQGPFAPGTFIFAPNSDPIDGFTQTDFGTVVESLTFAPPLNTGRSFSAGAVLNDRFYAIGGDIQTSELDSVEMLDPLGNGTWALVASLPSKRSGVCAAAANGRVYAFGGLLYNPLTILSDNLEYNPDTDEWTPRAPLLTPRAAAAAVAVNNR